MGGPKRTLSAMAGFALGMTLSVSASPDPVFWNALRLVEAKRAYAAGGGGLQKALQSLLGEADKAAAAKPPSVMDKTSLPPSGDKHDYVSQALYWWSDPSKPDGLPYIQKDGQANPETKRWQDREHLGDMSKAVSLLALAWYVTGKASYASACAGYLRAWFLNPVTRMNPHLEFAQFIPGANTGRGTGLIETRDLTAIPDALALLEGSPALTVAEREGIRVWFAAYFRWFRDSGNGKEESAAKNNHGTFYDVQAIAFARFIGETDTARALALAARDRRIAEQIEPDGRMPEELKRTQALHYVAFNLAALFNLAQAGRAVGVSFKEFSTVDGRSLRKAMQWARPYLLGEEPWTYPQIEPFKTREALLAFFLAAEVFSDGGYWADAARVPGQEAAADWAYLVHHTEPTVGLLGPRSPAIPSRGAQPWALGRFDALGRLPRGSLHFVLGD